VLFYGFIYELALANNKLVTEKLQSKLMAVALSTSLLTSRLKGQKTVGFCSFVANYSQQFFAS